MKIFAVCLLFLVFAQISAGQTASATTTAERKPTSVPTASSAATDTTVPPTTQPPSPGPTTIKPGTTTKPEMTTTPSPTTPHPNTTVIPITTVGPATESTNNYTVYGHDKKPCLLAKFMGHFSDGKNTWHIGPSAAVVNESSDCSKLFVKFEKGTFKIDFNKTTESGKASFYITAVTATLKSPSVEANQTGLNVAKASNGSSYMCLAGITIGMSENVTFTMTKVQLQAYWVGKEGKFATALQCSADFSNSILVPVIVGCALGGLIVIVLLAYCIARARVSRKYDPVDNSI